MTRAELLSAIMEDTGLNRETVKDLLKKGWVYVKAIGEVSRFEAPGLYELKAN